MLLSDFLLHATRLTYLLLGLLSLAELARRRDRARLDIALFFGALAFVLGVQEYFTLANVRPDWLVKAIQLATLTHSYFLLRVLENLRPAPRWVVRAAFIGLIVAWVIWLVFVPAPPLWLNLLTVAYMVAVDFYAMVSMVRGAITTRGITRRRLQFAALGIALIVAPLLFSVASSLLPVLAPITSSLILMCVAASGLAFYLGFAPPRFLRRYWQMSQLQRFLTASAHAAADEPVSAAYERLCQGAGRAVGAHAAFVVTRGIVAEQLAVAAATEPAVAAWWVAHWPEGWQLPPQSAQPMQVAVPAAPPAGSRHTAETAYLVPLGGRSDVLTVLLHHRPLFPIDDLSILHLLGTHSALVLDQQALIGRLQARTADLETVNQELEAFAYSVSHDLRTPLRHIEGFADLLVKSQAVAASGQRYLTNIQEAATRMAHMIDVLLGFSRLGRAELNVSRVGLTGLVAQVAAELEPDTHGREVHWQFHPLPDVLGDPMLLRRAWSNLLSNALKYTRTRPVATIEVGALSADGGPAGQVTLYVRDNGVGFDPAYVGRLFTVFQRLHAPEAFEGEGLGLAIVRRIIQRHHGRVWAEGALDGGATFYLTLPLATSGALALFAADLVPPPAAQPSVSLP